MWGMWKLDPLLDSFLNYFLSCLKAMNWCLLDVILLSIFSTEMKPELHILVSGRIVDVEAAENKYQVWDPPDGFSTDNNAA